MTRTGELASFRYLTPAATARTQGHDSSLVELLEAGESVRPDVILIATPNSFGHDPAWVQRFLRSCGDPVVVYYEIDPWGGRAKRINRSMEAWLAAADIIFTTAREPHISLFRKKGGRDIRFIPPTYCQITFTEAERTPPQDGVALAYDVVMVGSGLAHWGRVSQLPGAVQRATLVRRLQREPNLRVAIYGGGWSGRGAMGLLPHGEQPAAIRQGLISVNWDHYPQHESYASDRLPISMLAGRAHVTTAHPRFDWLPSEETGLFLAPTVPAVLRRIEEIMATPVEDILALGAAAHRWVKGRLSHREAARFMLAAIDTHLLDGLPEPWIGFARDWPN